MIQDPQAPQSQSTSTALLRCIAEAAGRGEDLVKALSTSTLPAAQMVARSLEQGHSLPQACQRFLHPDLARVLAGPRPGPAESALLLATLLDESQHSRLSLIQMLAYPFVSLLAFLGLLLFLSLSSTITVPWLAILIPFSLALLLPLIALFHLGSQRPVSIRFLDLGWQQAIKHIERWQYAAAILSWRLPEAEAEQLFGAPATRLAAASGADQEGVEHCLCMAHYHRQRARQRSHSLAFLLCLLIQICGGWIAILLASALWHDVVLQLN